MSKELTGWTSPYEMGSPSGAKVPVKENDPPHSVVQM